jgi:hypothetical protein
MCATCNILRQLLIDRGMSPGLAMAIGNEAGEQIETVAPMVVKKAKRKASAYSKRYGAAYRRLRKKHTLKNGKLRKGYTHKRLVKMAHKEAGKK